MLLNNSQISFLKKNRIALLSSSSVKLEPRAIFVELNQVATDSLVITDNEMKTTKNNLLKNKKVFILGFAPDYSRCLKIVGEAKYFSSGKLFDQVKALKENQGYKPKGIIQIKVKKVS